METWVGWVDLAKCGRGGLGGGTIAGAGDSVEKARGLDDGATRMRASPSRTTCKVGGYARGTLSLERLA